MMISLMPNVDVPVPNDPVFIWGSLIVSGVTAAILRFPTLARHFVDGADVVIDSMRRTSASADEAGIASLKQQVDILSHRVDQLADEIYHRDAAADAVTDWANDVRSMAAAQGIRLPPMPSLYHSPTAITGGDEPSEHTRKGKGKPHD